MQPQYGTTQGQPTQAVPLLVKSADWTTGVFNCFDDLPSCCDGYWCAYCQMSAQYNTFFNNQNQPDLLIAFAACCAAGCTGGLAAFFFTIYLRLEAKKRFGLIEDDLTSCVLSYCCGGCSTCQLYREMSTRGLWPGGCLVSVPYVPLVAPAPAKMTTTTTKYAPVKDVEGVY